jgi:hypothetical protein
VICAVSLMLSDDAMAVIFALSTGMVASATLGETISGSDMHRLGVFLSMTVGRRRASDSFVMILDRQA